MTATIKGGGGENHEGRRSDSSELERRRHDLELVDQLEKGIQDRNPRARIWTDSKRRWLFGGVATFFVLKLLFPQYTFRHGRLFASFSDRLEAVGFQVLVVLAAIAVGRFVLGRRSGF